MRLTAAALKQRYAELRDLVNEWDPVGLIDAGAPQDENCHQNRREHYVKANDEPRQIYDFLKKHAKSDFCDGCWCAQTRVDRHHVNTIVLTLSLFPKEFSPTEGDLSTSDVSEHRARQVRHQSELTI